MTLLDMVNRVKGRSHRGNTTITTDAATQQIIDAVNDARRDLARLIPKQWFRATSTFNTTPASTNVPGTSATAGTSTSASSPGTSAAATTGTLLVALNGEAAQSFTVSTSIVTAATIAAAIQASVRALIPVLTYNQPAYTNFTCTYTGGLYVLTSGMLGTPSSVVVTATGTIGSTLKLGLANGGTEAAGVGAPPQNPLAFPLYDLPADCQEPILFRYNLSGADYFLSRVESEREFYLNVFGTTVAPSTPLFFFDAGVNQTTSKRQVYIWPIANTIYTVFLTYMVDVTLTDLTTSGLNAVVPYFPSYTQDALWKGALYYFLKNFDDPAQAVAKQDYEEAKLALDEADEKDLDSDMQFRFDVGRRIGDFNAPGTGIRLK